jgi:hypothetical protein
MVASFGVALPPEAALFNYSHALSAPNDQNDAYVTNVLGWHHQ